jgi:hypothetical protein
LVFESGTLACTSTCQVDDSGCFCTPGAVFPGDGVDGPALSYTDNMNGTFTDNNTLLMWEVKDTSGGIHDVSNTRLGNYELIKDQGDL